MINNPLYAIDSLDVYPTLGKKEIHLQVKYGYYFDFINTCGYLEYEMAKNCMHRKNFHGRKNFLPERRKISADLCNFENRFAGIGINTLTILKNIQDDNTQTSHTTYILMHARSQEVAEGTGAIHVVPAGSYQPQEVAYDETRSLKEFEVYNSDLTKTVQREFEEEILGRPEFCELYNANLLKNSDIKKWSVYYLGIGIEPFNTKIEILTALIIDYTNDTKTTLKTFTTDMKKEYEGDVTVHQLTEDIILQFENNPRSTPACQQIMKMIRTLMQDTVYPE